jgi:hypothetical protein
VYKKSQNLVMIIIEITKPFNLKFFIIFGPILNTKWLFINIFLGRGEGRQIWKRGGGGGRCQYINDVKKWVLSY